MPPGVGTAPPRGGVLGPPTGVPPWTGVYPPGTIANYKPVLIPILRKMGVL